MGHIHAAAMAEYAKDAAETDMPWERWEVSFSGGFTGVTGHPNWSVNHEYRRKPKVILINGYEVPEPHRTPLRMVKCIGREMLHSRLCVKPSAICNAIRSGWTAGATCTSAQIAAGTGSNLKQLTPCLSRSLLTLLLQPKPSMEVQQ